MVVHCLFEQSGTFKKVFNKLGVIAYDYDICNNFGETDYLVDIFNEIEFAYDNLPSIFDNFSAGDLIFAFFPCIRFEQQIILSFTGVSSQLQNKTDIQKLEYDLILHRELSYLYNLITKLCLVALKRGLRLIIENPYNKQHYLTRYWCLKPSFIDFDRVLRGDIYKKPTQYWFINCKPKYNFVLDPISFNGCKKIINQSKVNRSLFTLDYVERFIKEFIL